MGEVGVVALLCLALLLQENVGDPDLDSWGSKYGDLLQG